MARLSNNSVILITEWSRGGTDQITNLDLTELEVSPVWLDAVEGDDVAGWCVEGGAGAPVQRIREVGIVDLPARVDLVDHGVQRVPDRILGRDVDRVHLAADAEVGARVDA